MAFSCKWPLLAQALDFHKISQRSSILSLHTLYLWLSCPRPGTSKSQSWFTAWPLPGPSKPSTSSSHLQIVLQLMPGGSRQGPSGGWPCTPQEAPEQPGHPVDSFRPSRITTQPPPRATHSRGRLDEHRSPTEARPCFSSSWPSQLIDPGGCQSLPVTCRQQSRLNYNGTVHTAHTGVAPEHPPWVTGEAAPLGPTGHLLHKASLPSPGDTEALPNT